MVCELYLNKAVFKDYIYYLERGEGKEKERERNINMREKH